MCVRNAHLCIQRLFVSFCFLTGFSATSQGFQFAAANPEEAAHILIDAAKEHCGYVFEVGLPIGRK